MINGLTNEFHPCRITADIFTFTIMSTAAGSIAGKTVAWVGDGSNMANTWLRTAELLGFTVHVSTPSGYGSTRSHRGRAQPRRLQGLQDRWTLMPQRRPESRRTSGPAWAEAENEARKRPTGESTAR